MDSGTFGPSYGKATLNGEVPPLPADDSVMKSERNRRKTEGSIGKNHFFGANVGNFKQPFTKPLEPTSINCTYGYKKRNSNFLILLSRLLYLTIEERISVRKAKMSTKFLFIDCHHIIIICEKELNEATNKLFLALKPIQTILRLVQLN